MAGRKRNAASSSRSKASDIPDIYQEMLADVGASARNRSSPERPLKRLKRPGEKLSEVGVQESAEDDDDGIEFEDVVLPVATVQTAYKGSEDEDDDDDDDDIEFEDVDFGAVELGSDPVEAPKQLELNLTAHKAAATPVKRSVDRRKPITKAERDRRAEVHKTHLLCLLTHSARRNRWCSDTKVQETLRPLLTQNTISYLNPGTNLPQFGRTESLKNGLQQVADVFKANFEITERGLRRALWAEEPAHLSDYEPPGDLDSCLDRSEFREAAKKLQGSRDTGAQLCCALLRCAGVRARLVCSLQPLAIAQGGPTLPKPRETKKPSKQTAEERVRAQLAMYKASTASATTSSTANPSPRRRLGHPNAAAYNFEPISPVISTPRQSAVTPKRIRESPFPVYWVEVLDVAHQKWQPFDPLVTGTMWKPRALEPPASDKENCMSYVIGFEADGTARDVTRRYAKAYAAKTRKLRVEVATENGERWWRKAMRAFRRRNEWPSDLDQIEDNELSAIEAREPMPRNVADFKDHPVYALERHLRRHEVLVPGAQAAGTVGAGSKGPLEKIYRRKDVRIARGRDKWYRMGREVKPLEIPVKFLPRRANTKPGEYVDDGYGGDERDAAGLPVFMMEQTEVFKAPPVTRGRVPKNKFGNIDLYVPSMVPEGGVHIADEHELARKASFILGIDYAPALTGFDFKGKKGTAVLNGVVVAKEYEAAVRAVMEGLGDVDAEMEQARRAYVAIRTWKRLLVGLRIRERIWAGVDPEERAREETAAAGEEAGVEASGEDGGEEEENEELEDAPSDVTEEYTMEIGDEDDAYGGGGGGFLID